MAVDLKKEEDVKEYIENLGIEYRFGCYKEKKPEVCHLLGDYLEAIKKDFDKAGRVFKNNCEEFKYAKSCLKIGNYTLVGKGRQESNPNEALGYFESGCELGEPTACLHAGLIYTASDTSDIPTPRDVPKGFNYLKKSCEAKVDGACFYLSGMYIRGVPKPGQKFSPNNPSENKQVDFLIKPDMKEAFKYAQLACDLDNMYACSNLSQMYKKGDGTEKNDILAQKFKRRSIELQEAFKNAKELKFQQGLDGNKS